MCAQAVLDAGALRAFLDCLDSSQRLSIKKEVVWSLSNIAAGNGQQIEALLDAGEVHSCIPYSGAYLEGHQMSSLCSSRSWHRWHAPFSHACNISGSQATLATLAKCSYTYHMHVAELDIEL